MGTINYVQHLKSLEADLKPARRKLSRNISVNVSFINRRDGVRTYASYIKVSQY